MKTAPLVVAGMHRSGTSLVSSLVSALGVDMGTGLWPPDGHNPRGYHEDAGFVRFHGRVLETCTRDDDGGHRDWGWTESEALDLDPLAGVREEAAAMLAGRADATDGGPWGWKDPRTTVLLDFWDALTHGRARYLFVYRYPWDVADSMQRLAAPVFLDNPDYAYRIWQFYNRKLLEFRRRHPERTALVSVNALLENPVELRKIVTQRLGVELGESNAEGLVEPAELRTLEGRDPLIRLVAATSPESVELLQSLDEAADLSARGRWSEAPNTRAPLNDVVRDSLLIVTPCHDDGQFLIEALASAEREAPGCEHVIVNDGSQQARTVEILEILRGLGYSILDQPNRGLSAARNRVISETAKRYILPLDADNRLRQGFVEEAVALLEADDRVGVVHGDWWEFGMRNGRHEVPPYDPETLLWGNTIDACAVLRRAVWEDAGGYDPVASPLDDWALWLSAGRAGWGFAKVPGITFDYRVRPHSLVTLSERPEVAGRIAERVVQKHREAYLNALYKRIGIVTLWPLEVERRRDEAAGRAEVLQEELRAERADYAEQLAAERAAREEQLANERAAVEESLRAEREAHAEELAAERAARADELAAERAARADELARERAAREHELMSERAKHEGLLHEERVRREALEDEVAGLRSRIGGLELEVARHRELSGEWRRAGASAVADLEISRNEASEWRERAAAERERAEGALDELESTRRELATAEATAETVRKERDDARRRLEVMAGKAADLEAELEHITGTHGWAVLSFFWRIGDSLKRLLGRT